MQLYGKSNVGLVRKSNQDRFAYGELPGESAWLVVCDGAGSAQVRLAIVEAVSAYTGLGSDKITVLTMAE